MPKSLRSVSSLIFLSAPLCGRSVQLSSGGFAASTGELYYGLYPVECEQSMCREFGWVLSGLLPSLEPGRRDQLADGSGVELFLT